MAKKRDANNELASAEEAMAYYRPVKASISPEVKHLLLHIEGECPFCNGVRPLASFRLDPLSGQGKSYTRFIPYCPNCNTLVEVNWRKSLGSVGRYDSVVDLSQVDLAKAPKKRVLDPLRVLGWAFLRWNMTF